MSGLRDRAAGNDSAPGSEVEKQEKFRETSQLIRKMESQFKMAMPKGMEATQLVRDALTLVRQNPGLLECTPESVLGALMTCAQLGLRPGVLQQAHLVPFRDKTSGGRKVAQLIIGYPGLAMLAYRSDQIASIIARVVYSNDLFHVAYGTEDRLVHEPAPKGSRGAATGYYCVVHIKGGRPVFEYMTKSDMEEHRDRFAKQRDHNGNITGPWKDDFDAMGKKTTFRKLANWIPRSTDLQTGLMADEGFRVDLTGDPADTTWHAEQVPLADGNEPKE